MFAWFRKNIRKIGLFGVEIEFRPPPKDVVTSNPEPVDVGVQERANQSLPSPSVKLRITGRVKPCPTPEQSDRVKILINRSEFPDVDKLPLRGETSDRTRNILLWIGGKRYRAGLRNDSGNYIRICPDMEDLKRNLIRLADVLNEAGFKEKQEKQENQDVEFELSVASASGLGE